jgi:membrane protein DedA with SNARE-associated domain
VQRYGSKIGLTAARFSAIEAVFKRYGAATVAFARFVNVLRQLNGIMAGILGMGWWEFPFFNALGGALWTLTWTLAGFYFSAHIEDITSFAHRIGLAGVFAAAALLAIVAAYLLWRSRRSPVR